MSFPVSRALFQFYLFSFFFLFAKVNKEEAARCRDLGADALRKGQNARAVKMFNKSLHLYPLPGVKVLLGQAERKLEAEGQAGAGREESSTANNNSSNNNGNSTKSNPAFRSASTASTASATNTGECGRTYTEAQVQIVQQVLRAKEGGRGAHYRVLGIEANCDESQIKKAYRKVALKLHPDKNPAPHADEAFKAVGLAYATLSDSQKRTIYDRYGEEDPDNRGGGGGGGGGMRRGPGGMHFHGQDVNPEDIFNMFFGGGMPPGAGGQGFRVHTSGFGPGFSFGGNPNMGRARAQQQQQHQRQQQAQDGGFGQFLQFLPLLLIMLLSFFNMPGENAAGGATGGSRYYSLTVSCGEKSAGLFSMFYQRKIPALKKSNRFVLFHSRSIHLQTHCIQN